MRNENELRKLVDALFEEAIDFIRSTEVKKGTRQCDLSGPILRRRKTEVLNSMPIVVKKYGLKYPELDVEKYWALVCSSSSQPINVTEQDHCISLAMALYMLDILSEKDRIDDALPLMELPEEIVEELSIPICMDCRYDQQIVQELDYLILNRDRKNDKQHYYLNETSAARTEPVNYGEMTEAYRTTTRLRFNGIMQCIDPCLKNRAMERFETAMWSFVDVLFSRLDRCVKKTREAAVNRDKYKKQFDALYDSTVSESPKKNPNMPIISPFDLVTKASLGMVGEADKLKNTVIQMESLSRQKLKWEERAEHLDACCHVLASLAHMIPFYRETCAVSLESEDVAAICELDIDDPFEICFGYLCLIESGSYLPWLYSPATAVLMMAVRKLPWTIPLSFGEKTEDLIEIDADGDDLRRYQKELYKLSLRNDVMRLPGAPLPDQNRKDLNMAQLVYNLTSVLMPRNNSHYLGFADKFIAAGIEPAAAYSIIQALQMAYDLSNYPIEHEDDLEDMEIEIDWEEQQRKVGKLKKQADDSKAEAAKLKAQLHDADKEVEALKAKLSQQMKENEEQRQELSDLRELIYQQANEHSDEYEQAKDEEIEFPYETAKRIAVFGGHDSWLKVIRPMLPRVTFIPRGQLPNEDLIRSQDAVWIQANAIAHKDFYKIVNVTRANHIPVYYFGFASAKKCAMQIVKYESTNL